MCGGFFCFFCFVFSLTLYFRLEFCFVLFCFWQIACHSLAGELPVLVRTSEGVCAVELGSSWTLSASQVLHKREVF